MSILPQEPQQSSSSFVAIDSIDTIDSDERKTKRIDSNLKNPDSVPPDGGKDAWLVVLGSFLAMFSSFGIVNSYGVFQDYYTSNLLSNSSSSTISLIGAIQLFLVYGLGPVVGRISDAYGTNILLPTGTFILVISTILTSFCQENQPYQFFLVQGILFGIGCAFIFTPGLAILGQWFRRRRGLVLGIVGAGSSGGGVVYPIMLQKLIVKLGFPWAVRITAFTALACLSVACVTLKPRLHLSRKIAARNIIDLGGFQDTQYTLAAVGSFLYFYALFIPYFYIQLYATEHGVDGNTSQYLLAIINALGIPARIIPGLLADRFGVLHVLVPCTLISGILVFALWLPARTSGPIIAFSALYGLFSGAFVSLLPVYVASRCPLECFGARLGSIYIFIAVATLVGTPTAGALVPTFSQVHFDHLIIFTGVLSIAGGASLGIAHLVNIHQEKRVRSLPTNEKGVGSIEEGGHIFASASSSTSTSH